jgi:hypothetical protein
VSSATIPLSSRTLRFGLDKNEHFIRRFFQCSETPFQQQKAELYRTANDDMYRKLQYVFWAVLTLHKRGTVVSQSEERTEIVGKWEQDTGENKAAEGRNISGCKESTAIEPRTHEPWVRIPPGACPNLSSFFCKTRP